MYYRRVCHVRLRGESQDGFAHSGKGAKQENVWPPRHVYENVPKTQHVGSVRAHPDADESEAAKGASSPPRGQRGRRGGIARLSGPNALARTRTNTTPTRTYLVFLRPRSNIDVQIDQARLQEDRSFPSAARLDDLLQHSLVQQAEETADSGGLLDSDDGAFFMCVTTTGHNESTTAPGIDDGSVGAHGVGFECVVYSPELARTHRTADEEESVGFVYFCASCLTEAFSNSQTKQVTPWA